MPEKRPILLALSIPLALLILLASVTGLVVPGFYSLETPNWQAQSIGQDIVNLFLLLPSLLMTAFIAYRGNRQAMLLWGGVVSYLIYTYVIYCFDVHFNRLFIAYCVILGLSIYAFLYFLYLQVKAPAIQSIRHTGVIKSTAIYLFLIAFIFYFLWLSYIIPTLFDGRIPKELADTGLMTNPVYVLDLAVLLPGLVILGIQLWRRRPLAFSLAPVILTFCILMDITIGVLVLLMKARNIESNLTVTVIMTVLAVVSVGLLVWYFRYADWKVSGIDVR